jgi:hypothetical protein
MADLLMPYYDPYHQPRPYQGAPPPQQSYAGAPPPSYSGFPQQQQSFAGAPRPPYQGAPPQQQQQQLFAGAPTSWSHGPPQQQQQSYSAAPPPAYAPAPQQQQHQSYAGAAPAPASSTLSLIDFLDTTATPTGWNVDNNTSLLDMPATPTGWNTGTLNLNNTSQYNQVTPSPVSTSSSTYSAASNDTNQWSCPECTLMNAKLAPVCSACQTINPTVIKEAVRGSNRSAPASSNGGYGGDSYRRSGGGGQGYEASSRKIVPLERANYNSYERNGGALVNRPNQAMQPYYGADWSVANAGEDAAYYHNPQDTETPLERKDRRRTRRRLRMVAGGAAGVVAGTLVAGPVGTFAGCMAGVAAARAASKNGEQKKDARRVLQQEHVQQHQPPRLEYQQQPPRLEY